MIDKGLIKKCVRGDRKAQYALYKHCYALLMPVGMRYYKDQEDASSAVNLLVVKVMDKYHLWKEGVPFNQWAKRIYINAALDTYRREKKGREVHQIWNENQQTSHNDINETWNAEAVEYLIQQLPKLQKTIFQLNIVEGYNHGEISNLLDISESNSRYQLHRARKTLKEAIMSNKQTI